MLATQVLPETCFEEQSDEENDSDVVGIITLGDDRFEIKKGENKIGRDSSLCTIVLKNFTVSKLHAVIESEGRDDTFIYDAGSTNQTKLGKKPLKPYCRYKLDDGSVITLGNVIGKFIITFGINDCLKTETITPPNSAGKGANIDDLDDIFDAVTQVPQPSTSRNVPDAPTIVKNVIDNPSVATQSCFDAVTQCQLYSQKSPVSEQLVNHSIENLSIFNLETQCPVLQQPHKNQCANEISDVDKMKSLLNDGQDDVLCTFMNLHSPNGQNLLKGVEIKTEVISEDVLDATTQVNPEVSSYEKDIEQLKHILNNKSFNEEFSTKTSLDSNQDNPEITEVSSNDKNLHDGMNEDTSQPKEEDFISTQKFHQDNTAPEKPEMQSYLEITLDSPAQDQGDNENFILTQKFPVSENVITLSDSENIPKDEDLLSTQVYDNTKEKSKIVEQNQDDDSYLEVTLDFTQRDNDDDFIYTQPFPTAKKTEISDRHTENGSNVADKPSDLHIKESTAEIDEDTQDFIATQVYELPGYSKTVQSNQESFPDLGNSPKLTQDFIGTQIFEEVPSTSKAIKRENDLTIPRIIPETNVEDSGDETESDLEIIMDSRDVSKNGFCASETEEQVNRCEVSEVSRNPSPRKSFETEENHDSESSYIFEVEPENQIESKEVVGYDSDATDCGEIEIKQEPIEHVQFEETQVLTLSPPSNFLVKSSDANNDWMIGKSSPRLENEKELDDFWNVHIPNREETNAKMQKNQNNDDKESSVMTPREEDHRTPLRKRAIDSPLKRVRETKTSEVPVKKPKISPGTSSEKALRNDRQFSKLWQAHDIDQIQPSRTRNSRNPNSEDTTEPPNRRSNPRRGNSKNLEPADTKKGRKRTETSKEAPATISRNLRSSKSKTEISNPRLNVAFTGFDCESLDKTIKDLGGKKINSLSTAEVVVTDKARRTVKFLCAIGLSLPITSPQWLIASKKERKFLNPWDFILNDEEAEEKWNFQLRNSLERSKKCKLLEGFSIFATESAKPPVKDLLAIVECCGGTPLFKRPDTWPKKSIVVSCPEDNESWPPEKCRNVKLVHYEFILSGVLRQKIDFKTYALR